MLHPSGALGISACPAAKRVPNQSRSIESKVKQSLLKRASTSSKLLQLWATEIPQLRVLSHGRACYQKSWVSQGGPGGVSGLCGNRVVAFDGGATLCKQLRYGHWSQTCSTVRMSGARYVDSAGVIDDDVSNAEDRSCRWAGPG